MAWISAHELLKKKHKAVHCFYTHHCIYWITANNSGVFCFYLIHLPALRHKFHLIDITQNKIVVNQANKFSWISLPNEYIYPRLVNTYKQSLQHRWPEPFHSFLALYGRFCTLLKSNLNIYSKQIFMLFPYYNELVAILHCIKRNLTVVKLKHFILSYIIKLYCYFIILYKSWL